MKNGKIKIPDTGISLIEASAGTGKTFTLAEIYIRLITEKKLTVDKILVVTFTNAAVKELRARIRKRITETGEINSEDKLLLENAARDFDKSAIFTIHGFCRRILEENAFESGSLYNTTLETDSDGYYKNIINDFWRKNFINLPETVIMFIKRNQMSRLLSLLKSVETGYEILTAGKKTREEIFIEDSVINNSYSRLMDLFLKLKEIWNTPAIFAEITEFVSDKRLNQTSYKNINSYIKQMNLFLKRKQPEAELFKYFNQFTETKILSCINKNKNPDFKPELNFFKICGDYRNTFDELNSFCSDYITGLEYRFPAFIKTELNKIKDQNNILFYNDLIERTHEALNKKSGKEFAEKIRHEFKAALIDEFQDTDRRQYEIFYSIFRNNSILFLIGDPKQSIYGFRGADVFTYLKAVKDAENKETLEVNWRSDSGLISSVNSIFSRIKNPFLFSDIPFQPVNPPQEFNSLIIDDNHGPLNVFFMTDSTGKNSGMNVKTAKDFADSLTADEIARILNLSENEKAYIIDKKTGIKNKIKASDIAVLVKKNKNGITVQNMLRERGIPSVIYSTGSVFQSIEAEELLRIMKAISVPSDITALKSALPTSILGYNADKIIDEMDDEGRRGIITGKFRQWKEIWEKNGFIAMINKLLKDEEIKSSMIKYSGGERAITNIGHISELIHEAEENSNLSIDGSITWLYRKITEENISSAEEHQLRLETDENAVTIISIHKSKGLEYGIVFCPDIWDSVQKNIFIKYHENNNIVLDISPDETAENISDFESLAEELRLIYVALTRARYRMYTAWGKIKNSYDSAAAFLFHSPADFNPAKTDKRPQILNNETEISNMISELETIQDITVIIKDIVKDTDAITYKIYEQKIEKDKKLNLQKIDFGINSGFKIFSYSSLVKKNPKEEKDRDYLVNSATEYIESIDKNIFQFPKGAETGNFFHEIFEESDYTDIESINKKAIEKIQKYNIDEIWLKTAVENIKKILEIDIETENSSFRLNQLNFSSRCNELEFYFPINNFNSTEFLNILNEYDKILNIDDIPEIQQEKGFIRGFIDLVAEKNGRYYIFDWKTNHLGDSQSDYNPESLKKAMKDGNYFLQAIIYSLAVNRYLKSRINNYSYSEHFGGTYYVFTRGFCGGYDSSFCHYRPEEKFINSLYEYILGGN